MGLLVMAAAPEELGPLEGAVVGVGPVVAAANTARILERDKPDRVVLIGTAGAYPGGPAIGQAVAASRVGLSWGVAAMGLGYVPRAPKPVECDVGLLARIKVPQHAVLTVGAITTDRTLARRIADGYTVEHLEAFGVALACKQAGVPFVAVLGITNDVGPDAHVQWLTHRDAAQQAARDAIQPLLA
ncbi:MAG: phosphorylase [Alphaproteobacteria bacterium]|nr:phosphorylase [Alphaproteobacteria bacterium]